MLKLLVNTVVKPLAERLGTAAAVGIVAGGEMVCAKWGACGLVTESGAHITMQWVLAAGFVVLDLVVANVSRRQAETKAVESLIARNGG